MANPVKQRLAQCEWTSEKTFRLDGVEYVLENLASRYQGTAYSVMKPLTYLRAYAEVIRSAPTRNVFELGIRKGGSAVFLASLFQVEKLATLDIIADAPALERFRKASPLGARIAPYFETSQDDEAKLREIVAKEFDGPLDVVIDDASHDYHLTRASLEILLPRIRPHGFYIIEDWQWAHQRGFREWKDKPALSNLVFQLMIASVSHPELIAKIHIYGGLAFVQKGSAEPDEGRLNIEELCWMQGRKFNLL